MAHSAYNEQQYKRYKLELATRHVPCWFGCGRRATSPDHYPPLSEHTHRRGSGCCVLRPACRTCQHQQGANIRNRGNEPHSRVW